MTLTPILIFSIPCIASYIVFRRVKSEDGKLLTVLTSLLVGIAFVFPYFFVAAMTLSYPEGDGGPPSWVSEVVSSEYVSHWYGDCIYVKLKNGETLKITGDEYSLKSRWGEYSLGSSVTYTSTLIKVRNF